MPTVIRVAVAAVVLLGASASVVFEHAEARNGPCGRSNVVRVIAKKHGATVYVLRGSDGRRTEMCDRGRRVQLDFGGSDSRVQYASVTITRTRVAYAVSDCGFDDGCETVVAQHPRHSGDGDFGLFGFDPTPLGRVSRLRIGRGGAIAWISCKHGASVTDPSPYLENCRAPRRMRHVYVLPANPVPDPNLGGPPRPPMLLHSGRNIRPYSLAIGKKRVTWRHNGRLRSALIPPPQDPPLDP